MDSRVYGDQGYDAQVKRNREGWHWSVRHTGIQKRLHFQKYLRYGTVQFDELLPAIKAEFGPEIVCLFTFLHAWP